MQGFVCGVQHTCALVGTCENLEILISFYQKAPLVRRWMFITVKFEQPHKTTVSPYETDVSAIVCYLFPTKS
jgi:hypothetical protein